MNYNSITVKGHDYSTPLRDMLPEIIGKRSKSVQQIAKAAGRQAQTVGTLINRLHKRGVIHIKRWVRGAGPYVAHYIWGAGVDAPRPAAQPRSAIVKRYQQSEKGKKACASCRDRWKKSERGQEYQQNSNKARWAREKISKGGLAAIDPLLAAIMGSTNQPKKEQTCT